MATDPAVIYFVGPNGPVDVPLARASNVQFGDAVHVPDEQVRAGLLIQDGLWSTEPPKPAGKTPKTDPATAGGSTDTPKE